MEMSDNRNHNRMASGGSGVQGWFSGGHTGRRQRESLSSSSEPKTPVLAHAQEVDRIETVLIGAPLISPTSRNSERFNRYDTVGPNSSSSLLDGSATGFSSTNYYPTRPEAVARQTSIQAMEEIIHSVRRLQNGVLEETQITDIEAQQRIQQPDNIQKNRGWWWQKPRWKGLQSRLITAAISGSICTIVLSIYLGLVFSNHLRLRQEWHVLIILIILVTTLLLCHALVGLCMDLTGSERQRNTSIAGQDGYANPRSPIRVNPQSPGTISEPPPVYGLWRCSVRVNPNGFYWIRRQSAGRQRIPEGEMTSTSPGQGRLIMSPRPPSYLSDDGISYVVNAIPEIRTEQPLPTHSSVLRRLA